MNLDESTQLTRVVTLVEDMHHRLFGNGQPGIVKEQNDRLDRLEAEKDRFSGAIRLVKFGAVLTPVIVAITEFLFHRR